MEDSTDEDERTTSEETKSTPPSSAKSSSSTKYLSNPVTDQSNRLRRRRFLIFDKLPPRGFKRLKPKLEDNNTTTTLSAKYKFGDGFSKDEAKPNGLVQLGFHPAAKRKTTHTESKVGALDLTQSSFTSSPRKDATLNQGKTRMTRKRAYDNSFLPDPKHAERQRKRQRQLKKDNPLNDKEMLPPVAAAKPKMILTSAILSRYANLAEGAHYATDDAPSEQEPKQTAIGSEKSRKEEVNSPPSANEEYNTDDEEPIGREPSVELGEFQPGHVPGHSAVIYQQVHSQQQKHAEVQEEDLVEVLSEEVVEKPINEHTVQEATDQEPGVKKPAQDSPNESLTELLSELVENYPEKPVDKPTDAQGPSTRPVHTEEVQPKPTTVIEESASSKSSLLESSTRGTGKNIIHTAECPKPTISGKSTGQPQYHHQRRDQSQSQRSTHREAQDVPPPSKGKQGTSPGSGWETYVSETDIRTPTPPSGPLNSRAKSMPSVSGTSRGQANPGLTRSNSGV